MKTVPVPVPNSERRDWFEPVLTSLDRSVHIHVTAWYMRVWWRVGLYVGIHVFGFFYNSLI